MQRRYSICLSWSLVVLALGLARPASAQVKVGDAPDYSWKTPTGRTLTPAAFKGALVVLEFWAGWCDPCMAQAEHMVKLHKEFGPRGVSFVGVNLDRNTTDMEAACRSKGFTWEQVFDATRQITKDWGVTGIPRVFILSPEGKVLWTGHPARLDGPLAEAVKEHPGAKLPGSEAERLVAEAAELFAANDFARAVATLEMLKDEDRQDAKVQAQLRELGSKVFTGTPAEHRPTLQRTLEAHRQIARLLSRGGAPGPGPATRPAIPAHQLELDLKKAQAAHQARRFGDAWKLYRSLAQGGGESAQAAEARTQLAAYEADAAIMAQVKQAQRQEEAAALLAMGRSYQQAGKDDLARVEYTKVVESFADTPAAAEAKIALETLK